MPENLQPHQLDEFLRGYRLAQSTLNRHETYEWFDGFIFWALQCRDRMDQAMCASGDPIAETCVN